jgi:hypothetical protein
MAGKKGMRGRGGRSLARAPSRGPKNRRPRELLERIKAEAKEAELVDVVVLPTQWANDPTKDDDAWFVSPKTRSTVAAAAPPWPR